MARLKLIDNGPFAGLPRRHFRAIVADPPWLFKARTALQVDNWKTRRDVEKHYQVMSIADICALPVRELAHDDCHLFLWTTGPALRESFKVMEAWGFKYSTVAFVWTKLRKAYNPQQLRVVPAIDADFHVGLGLTTRKNVEYVLLGRRGNAKRISRRVRELILSPRREHSRKPDEMYARVMQYCAGPYCELFSREQRNGWTTWGDEAGKFNGG